MKFMAIIRAESATGRALLALRQHDAIYEGHPALTCAEADLSHPHWARLETVRNKGNGWVYLPHSDLVMLAEGKEAARAFGFAPSPG